MVGLEKSPGERMRDEAPFRTYVPFLIYLSAICYLSFIARIFLAPLLPTIESDLNIGHAEAGSFFFFISAGYVPGLLGSGYVSSRLTHRWTVILSSVVFFTLFRRTEAHRQGAPGWVITREEAT